MKKTIKKISSTALENATPAIFKILLIAIFLIAAIYVYFISFAVINAAQNEKIIKKISELQSQKIELEEKYMELADSLDADYAYVAGFKLAENVAYVSASTFARR